MLKFFLFLAFAASVLAEPASTENDKEYEVIPIVKSETNKKEDGSYRVEYEGADGTSRLEEAVIVDEALEVKGSYKYINDEGKEVEVFYTAGKNGFVPYGTIINPEISAAAEAAKDLPSDDEEEKPRSKKAETLKAVTI